MEVKELMDVTLKAGEILLKSGAETYRVEDTMTRVCRSYGVDCECFVMPTGIFISTSATAAEPRSLIKRIKSRSVDLNRIELINAFSRSLRQKPVSYQEAMAVLNDISKAPRYKYIIRLLAAAFASFVFTLLFNGRVEEGLVAALISMLVYAVNEQISQTGFFQFFEYFISGLIVGISSLAAVRIFPDLSIYKIIIGSIMILVPGVAMTNGIIDALHGDTGSSMFRLAEAVFIAAAVGTGVGIALTLGLWRV